MSTPTRCPPNGDADWVYASSDVSMLNEKLHNRQRIDTFHTPSKLARTGAGVLEVKSRAAGGKERAEERPGNPCFGLFPLGADLLGV
eukprot:g31410.t1